MFLLGLNGEMDFCVDTKISSIKFSLRFDSGFNECIIRINESLQKSYQYGFWKLLRC